MNMKDEKCSVDQECQLLLECDRRNVIAELEGDAAQDQIDLSNARAELDKVYSWCNRCGSLVVGDINHPCDKCGNHDLTSFVVDVELVKLQTQLKATESMRSGESVVNTELQGQLDKAMAELASHQETIRGKQECLDSVAECLTSQPIDFSRDHRNAWMYWILLGWGDAEEEIVLRHHWGSDEINRVKRLRKQAIALPITLPKTIKPGEYEATASKEKQAELAGHEKAFQRIIDIRNGPHVHKSIGKCSDMFKVAYAAIHLPPPAPKTDMEQVVELIEELKPAYFLPECKWRDNNGKCQRTITRSFGGPHYGKLYGQPCDKNCKHAEKEGE